jgi:hypothetical protein
MIYPATDNPDSCEIGAVFHIFHAEIHLELCAVYDQNVMNEGTVRQLFRMFRDGQTNESAHDEEQSGRTSVVNDDSVQSVGKKILKDGASQFRNFCIDCECFLFLSPSLLKRSVLYHMCYQPQPALIYSCP